MAIQSPLSEWSLAFPLVECLHLLGIACALGTAALMNFRLMGVGVGGSPAKFWRETWLLTVAGLTVAIGSGLLLFTVDPAEYYANQVFRFKMAVLLAAIAFYFTMVRRAAVRDRKAAGVAVISLGLYALVPLGGIFLGYE